MKISPRRLIRQIPWLGLLLILTILSLALQIASPIFIRWWQLPRPGTVGIDFLASEFFQVNRSSCLAPGYVGYLPESYFQTQTWPLVVYLHGSGERGADAQILVDMGQLLSSPNSIKTPAVVLLPQCQKQASWYPGDVAKFVEYTCRNYRIDRQRIYLVGYSMGGSGTWATAAAYPDLFAAIVPISGGGDTSNAAALVNIPIWAFHGDRDKIVPAHQTTKLVEAVRALGGEPKLTIFSEAGHDISRRVGEMPELWQWLFEQRLGQSHVQPQFEAAVGEENKN